MANGLVLGRKNNSTEGVWEVAIVEITDFSMQQVPPDDLSGADIYFDTTIDIPDHTVFQTREFTSSEDLWNACGQSRDNIMVSSTFNNSGPSQILVGNTIFSMRYRVAAVGYSGGPAPFSSCTLYIFARFVD